MTKILYLIASHSNPDQVVRLVKKLKTGNPESQVLIHHDQSKSSLSPTSFEQINNVHILEDYVPVGWGDFSMVEMELRCINWLIDNSVTFDWLIFLSGQDYPLQPISQIEQFLQNTEYDGFMEYFPVQEPPETAWHWGKDLGIERYFFRYYKLPASLKTIVYKLYRVVNWQPLVRIRAGKFGAKIAIRCFSTPFTPEFQCYAGSQWHTLSYGCIEYIHQFVQRNPAFVEHYRNTLIPDESFIQSILLNQSMLKLFNDNKRYISWTPPYPAIMGVQDFESMITSGKHFARKFDDKVDAKVIDMLDKYIEEDRDNREDYSYSPSDLSKV